MYNLADANESDNMNCLLEKMKEIDPTDKHGQTPLQEMKKKRPVRPNRSLNLN